MEPLQQHTYSVPVQYHRKKNGTLTEQRLAVSLGCCLFNFLRKQAEVKQEEHDGKNPHKDLTSLAFAA